MHTDNQYAHFIVQKANEQNAILHYPLYTHCLQAHTAETSPLALVIRDNGCTKSRDSHQRGPESENTWTHLFINSTNPERSFPVHPANQREQDLLCLFDKAVCSTACLVCLKCQTCCFAGWGRETAWFSTPRTTQDA